MVRPNTLPLPTGRDEFYNFLDGSRAGLSKIALELAGPLREGGIDPFLTFDELAAMLGSGRNGIAKASLVTSFADINLPDFGIDMEFNWPPKIPDKARMVPAHQPTSPLLEQTTYSFNPIFVMTYDTYLCYARMFAKAEKYDLAPFLRATYQSQAAAAVQFAVAYDMIGEESPVKALALAMPPNYSDDQRYPGDALDILPPQDDQERVALLGFIEAEAKTLGFVQSYGDLNPWHLLRKPEEARAAS